MSEYRSEVAVFEGDGSMWPQISGGRRRPPPTICATYAVHVRLIGKPTVEFLLVIIELSARCYS